MVRWPIIWKRMVTLVIFLLGFAVTVESASKIETGFFDREITLDGVGYRYQIYIPVNYTPDELHPVILFLHGAGEQGEDGRLPTQVGLGPAIREAGNRFPFIVVFPQSHPHQLSGERATLALKTLDQTIKEFNGDPERIYLTGISMGGYATWYLAVHAPHKFAALVPISGYVTKPRPDLSAKQNAAILKENPFAKSSDPYMTVASQISRVPVWIFHGGADSVVWPEESRRMFQALKASGLEVRYTEYDGVGHHAWDKAYSDPDLWTWLLSHRRSRH